MVTAMVTSVFVGFMIPVVASTGASESLTASALDPASKTVTLEPTVEWVRYYGGDRADSVVEANDGSYVAAQSLDSSGDIRLLRVDSTGDPIAEWPKQYSVATVTDGRPQIVVEAVDGGFAVAGTTPFCVLKTDSAGTVQ